MENFTFDLPKNRASAIKVIGVGGGGNNAVNYMYQEGITGVDFAICNTDAQALNSSPIPNKIQLGASITEGLGAGANPEIGEQAAIESIEEIKALFGANTKMVFITAGMGGGTGTGAAPIIASIAKEMGILTVGIVTVPFSFEGKNRLDQAEKGLTKMRNSVDSLIIINNDKLRELYGNLGFKSGFAKADEILATAAKGIAEVITENYQINIDLRDVRTVLQESGTAIMGSARANGEHKAKEAISKALESPLLNDNKITGAKNVLLLILSGSDEITMDEITVINEHIQSEAGYSANIIMGVGEDTELGEDISVTIVATGFSADEQDFITREDRKIIHQLNEETDEKPISNTKTSVNSTTDSTTNPENEVQLKVEPIISVDEVQGKPQQEDNIIRFVLEEIEKEPQIIDNNALEEKEEEMFLISTQEQPQTNISVQPVTTHTIVEPQVIEPQFTEPTIFNLEDFDDEKPITFNLFDVKEEPQTKVIHTSEESKIASKPIVLQEEEAEQPKGLFENSEDIQRKIEERRARLKQYNAKFNNLQHQNMEDMEKIPAFVRNNTQLHEHKNETFNTYIDTQNDEIHLRQNRFLHNNID